MAEKPRLDTTRLQKMAQAYWESAALMAAVELEVFTAIAHGQDTIATVAKAVAWLGKGSRSLLLGALANEADPQAFRACHDALVGIVGSGPPLPPGGEAQAQERQAAVVAWRQW